MVSSLGTGKCLLRCLEHLLTSISSTLVSQGRFSHFFPHPSVPFLKYVFPELLSRVAEGLRCALWRGCWGWHLAQGSPCLSSQQPPCSPHCQHLGAHTCYTAVLHGLIKKTWLQAYLTTNKFSEKCVISCKRLHLAFLVLLCVWRYVLKKPKPLSEFHSGGSAVVLLEISSCGVVILGTLELPYFGLNQCLSVLPLSLHLTETIRGDLHKP